MDPPAFWCYRNREDEEPKLGLRTPERFVFIDENYDEADYEKHNHGGADEIIVAVDTKKWEMQDRKSAGLPIS